MLLERVGQFSAQVAGFVNDNPNLNHVLEQLRTISDILKERKFDLVDTLSTLAKFTASLAEAVASGPYFKVMLVNLLPPWLLQPFVDSAFKKRGIDPEEFWRNAGLPVVAVPRPERHAVPERRARAGTGGAGRHTGESGTRGRRRPPVLVHADGRRAAAAERSAAVLAPVDRPVRTEPVLEPARDRTTTPCPTCSPRRRTRTVQASRPVCPPRLSRVSCRRTWVVCPHRCRPLRRVRAPCRWARCLLKARTSRRASRRCRLLSNGPPPPPGPGPAGRTGWHAAAAGQPAVPSTWFAEG